MGVNFTATRCPDCGANLPIEEGRTQIFCSYCGANIIVTNDNEQIFKHIDVAEVKYAETDQMVKMKKLEIIEKNRLASEKSKRIKLKISIALGIVIIISLIITAFNDSNFDSVLIIALSCGLGIMYMWLFPSNNVVDDIEELNLDDKVSIPPNSMNFKFKHYKVIESAFLSAGFTNVKCVPIRDLTLGLVIRPGMVESVTINGKSVFSVNKKLPKNTPVIITYHKLIKR